MCLTRYRDVGALRDDAQSPDAVARPPASTMHLAKSRVTHESSVSRPWSPYPAEVHHSRCAAIVVAGRAGDDVLGTITVPPVQRRRDDGDDVSHLCSWHAHAWSRIFPLSRRRRGYASSLAFTEYTARNLKKRIDLRFDHERHALAPEPWTSTCASHSRLFRAASSSIALAQVSITFCCTYSNSDFAGCHRPFVASTSNAWGPLSSPCALANQSVRSITTRVSPCAGFGQAQRGIAALVLRHWTWSRPAVRLVYQLASVRLGSQREAYPPGTRARQRLFALSAQTAVRANTHARVLGQWRVYCVWARCLRNSTARPSSASLCARSCPLTGPRAGIRRRGLALDRLRWTCVRTRASGTRTRTSWTRGPGPRRVPLGLGALGPWGLRNDGWSKQDLGPTAEGPLGLVAPNAPALASSGPGALGRRPDPSFSRLVPF